LYGQGRVSLALWCHAGLVFSKTWVKNQLRKPAFVTWEYNFLVHQQPQGHNKQESTTFILPYGSNKQHCMDKEEFHWVFGVVQGWFSAKLGSKISEGSQLMSSQFPWPSAATRT
jgi:hypothetical protein